jgi:hypothetical protein
MTATIDYRDNLWLLSHPTFGAEIGFWTLPSALSFAINNLRSTPRLTNQAILAKYKAI